MPPTRAAYFFRPIDDEMLETLDRLLSEHADDIVRTRRGRVFDVLIDKMIFHVALEETASVLHDCEDQLLEFGLLPEDVPCRVVISSPTGAPAGYAILRSLSSSIVGVLGGRTSEPVN